MDDLCRSAHNDVKKCKFVTRMNFCEMGTGGMENAAQDCIQAAMGGRAT
jgi:hypothetical protein